MGRLHRAKVKQHSPETASQLGVIEWYRERSPYPNYEDLLILRGTYSSTMAAVGKVLWLTSAHEIADLGMRGDDTENSG
jgi:hypothetical protein